MSQPNIALIIETSFVSGRNILKGISKYARQHGPWLFHHEWRNTDLYYPSWLSSWQGDGIIARVESERIADSIRSLGVPIVDLLGAFPEYNFPLVHVDDDEIAKMAAHHLLDRGFQNFAYSGIEGHHWSERRCETFKKTVENEGYQCRVHKWIHNDKDNWSWADTQNDLTKWLRDLPKPTGMMLCNDLHSNIILGPCRIANIAIPEEIAIIGVDNDESLAEITSPPLSSVIPDDKYAGYEAAKLLDGFMRGKAWDGKTRFIKPSGVKTRLSTEMLAVNDSNIAQAVRLIREGARNGITVDDISNSVPICRTLLQRRFKAALGRSMHEEILRIRLEHACFLLRESDMQLSLIAEKSGFKHQEYMGAVFKKHYDTTPLQYRKKHKL